MEIQKKFTNEEIDMLDAGLSVLYEQMVANSGAIRESIIEFGDDEEKQMMLKSATDIKKDIKKLSEYLYEGIETKRESSNTNNKRLENKKKYKKRRN